MTDGQVPQQLVEAAEEGPHTPTHDDDSLGCPHDVIRIFDSDFLDGGWLRIRIVCEMCTAETSVQATIADAVWSVPT